MALRNSYPLPAKRLYSPAWIRVPWGHTTSCWANNLVLIWSYSRSLWSCKTRRTRLLQATDRFVLLSGMLVLGQPKRR
jgi:hypothetical protein